MLAASIRRFSSHAQKFLQSLKIEVKQPQEEVEQESVRVSLDKVKETKHPQKLSKETIQYVLTQSAEVFEQKSNLVALKSKNTHLLDKDERQKKQIQHHLGMHGSSKLPNIEKDVDQANLIKKGLWVDFKVKGNPLLESKKEQIKESLESIGTHKLLEPPPDIPLPDDPMRLQDYYNKSRSTWQKELEEKFQSSEQDKKKQKYITEIIEKFDQNDKNQIFVESEGLYLNLNPDNVPPEPTTQQLGSDLDYLTQDFDFNPDNITQYVEDIQSGNFGADVIDIGGQLNKDGLPILPTGPMPYMGIDRNNQLDNWAILRMIPQLQNLDKRLKEATDEINSNPYYQDPIDHPIPSVMNYFQLLPWEYQQNYEIIGLVNGLERFQRDIKRETKELYVNFFAYLLTPVNPQKLRHFREFMNQQELEQTNTRKKKSDQQEEVEEEVQITTEEEFFAYRAKQEEAKLKKMLGEDGLSTETEIKMPKMNRELLPEIEEPGEAFDWENPYGRIPCALNYYDNDDGYWDDWIRTKRERGGMPSITFREYFKH